MHCFRYSKLYNAPPRCRRKSRFKQLHLFGLGRQGHGGPALSERSTQRASTRSCHGDRRTSSGRDRRSCSSGRSDCRCCASCRCDGCRCQANSHGGHCFHIIVCSATRNSGSGEASHCSRHVLLLRAPCHRISRTCQLNVVFCCSGHHRSRKCRPSGFVRRDTRHNGHSGCARACWLVRRSPHHERDGCSARSSCTPWLLRCGPHDFCNNSGSACACKLVRCSKGHFCHGCGTCSGWIVRRGSHHVCHGSSAGGCRCTPWLLRCGAYHFGDNGGGACGCSCSTGLVRVGAHHIGYSGGASIVVRCSSHHLGYSGGASIVVRCSSGRRASDERRGRPRDRRSVRECD